MDQSKRIKKTLSHSAVDQLPMAQSEGEQVEEDHEANRGASDSDKGEPSDSQAS